MELSCSVIENTAWKDVLFLFNTRLASLAPLTNLGKHSSEKQSLTHSTTTEEAAWRVFVASQEK